MSGRRLAGLLVAACVGLAVPAALADVPAGATAIEEGERGVELYEQGRWEESLARFRTAEALYHSPVFVLYEARCLRNLNRWKDARRVFARLAAEDLPASAPEQWHAAKRDGAAELTAIDAALPRVVVSIRGATAATRLTVDGRAAKAGVVLDLDPGTHRFSATEAGRETTRTLTLTAGAAQRTVELVLAPASARRAVEAPSATNRGPYVPGVVLAATGGAALLAGGVFGVLALRKGDDTIVSLPASCVDRTCPEGRRREVEAEQDAARGLATASTTLLVGGAIVAATGVVLWLVDPRATEAPPRRSASRRVIAGVEF